MADNDLRHIFLSDYARTTLFTSPSSGGGKARIPARNTTAHGAFLRTRLDRAWAEAKRLKRQRLAVSLPSRNGAYLEFRSEPGFDLVVKSLEDRRSGIRLLAVRQEGEGDSEVTLATVFVPARKEGVFLRRVDQYLNERTRRGVPRHSPLLNSVADIRLAVLKSFWTDSSGLFPTDERPDWFEVWLSGDSEEVEQRFRSTLPELQIELGSGKLVFPERTVFIVHATPKQLALLVQASDDIAEIRKAKETAHFFLESPNADQVAWVQDLQKRLRVDAESNLAVCILDTGVNNAHVLLAPVLDTTDCQAVVASWGTHDHHGHGTLMAGLVAYGDLQGALEDSGAVRLTHLLESVKILAPRGKGDPELYGAITAQGVSLAEIQAPDRRRVICMAVTATDFRDRGQPSSWSAELDALSSGYADDERRLFTVCAGNVQQPHEWKSYPDSNLTNGVHDPGQSWNALTVGAHTWKTYITDPSCSGYSPVAPAGGLSPFSTTALYWESKWPAKPDVVLEGGNAGVDSRGFVSELDDLSLLSTSHQVTRRQFDAFNMTSAATAQAAWMVAHVQAAYPEAWPETLRALIVHSAEWTDAMKAQFLGPGSKSDYANLLRICGYGAPDLGRALRCATNSLTLIAQEELRPFDQKPSGAGYCTRDMHLYELPWPRSVLLDLGGRTVTMRVTLSYFVEPGPGRIGWRDRYRYASHALRFDVNAPGENRSEFLQRLNRAARDEGERPDTDSRSDRWTIGRRGRDRGSIHSDIWQGTGAELATCNLIGVYPIIGWWRERPHLGRWDRKARYSLVVSIRTPEQDIDIYTPVAIQVGIAVPIEIRV